MASIFNKRGPCDERARRNYLSDPYPCRGSRGGSAARDGAGLARRHVGELAAGSVDHAADLQWRRVGHRLRTAWRRSRRQELTPEPVVDPPLVARARRGVERLETLLELRRDVDAEPLAGRQALHEPCAIERHEVVLGRELAEGALDHGGKLRVVLAEHDAVGLV